MNKLFQFDEDWLENNNRIKIFIEDFLIPPSNRKAVIGLNSEYGTGKSIFIELCIKKIQEEYKDSIQYVNINISENEFEDSPLFTILNAIINKIVRERGIEDKEQILHLGKLASEMTVSLDLTTIARNVVESEDKLFEILTKDKTQVKYKFKKYLEQTIGEHKLVIFLDDLDRCSPDFAIKILEELKFYFKFIDNLIFVIAYDREQIESFIQAKFGSNIDCSGYLRKFFDTNYLFSAIEPKEFIEKTKDRCISYLEIKDKELLAVVNELITKMSKQRELLKHNTLRSIQQCIYRLIFGLKRVIENNNIVGEEVKDTLVILIFLRSTNWKLYSDLYKGKIDGLEVAYKIVNNKQFQGINNLDLFKYLLAYAENIENLESFLHRNIKKSKEYENKLDFRYITYEKDEFQIILNDYLTEVEDNRHIDSYRVVKRCLDILEYD